MNITESNIEIHALETARLEQEIDAAEERMKARIKRIKKEYEYLDGKHEVLANRLAKLREWADQHLDPDSDSVGRHLDIGSVRIGFRLSPWSVQLANPSNIGELEAARMLRLTRPEFVVDEPTLNKKALLARRTDPEVAGNLPTYGLKFAQVEDFYVTEKDAE